MSKNKFKKIIEFILNSGLIIKKRIDHDNGDISLRIGKEKMIKPKSKAPEWFSEWTKHNDKRLENMEDSMNNRFKDMEDSINIRFKNMEDSMNNRFDVIEQRLERIENTPTMKKELTKQ